MLEVPMAPETTPNREMLKEGTMPKRKPPGRKPNKEVRTREHLTEAECEALIAEARKGRNGVRDALLITRLWKHGLRASEATAVEWPDVDFTKGTLYCRRIKGSIASTHPI